MNELSSLFLIEFVSTGVFVLVVVTVVVVAVLVMVVLAVMVLVAVVVVVVEVDAGFFDMDEFDFLFAELFSLLVGDSSLEPILYT